MSLCHSWSRPEHKDIALALIERGANLSVENVVRMMPGVQFKLSRLTAPLARVLRSYVCLPAKEHRLDRASPGPRGRYQPAK